MKLFKILFILFLPSVTLALVKKNKTLRKESTHSSSNSDEVAQDTFIFTLAVTLFTTLVVPLCLKWAKSAVDSYYSKLDTDSPDPKMMQAKSKEVIERVNYWGKQTENGINSLKDTISAKLEQVGMKKRKKDYDNMVTVVGSYFRTFARLRANIESLTSFRNDMIWKESMTEGREIEYAVARLHNTGFQILLSAVQEVTKQGLAMDVKRSVVYWLYANHVGNLFKGWMAEAFVLDLIRYMENSNETLEQDLASEKFNSRINKTTQVMKKLLGAPSIKNIIPSQVNKLVKFYTTKAQSQIESNNVIIGLQFTEVDNVMHIKVKEALLEPNGAVDRTTKKWKMNEKDDQSFEVPYIIGDSLPEPPSDHVMTGLQFLKKNEMFACLEVQYHQFNFTTGIIDVNEVKLLNNCENEAEKSFQLSTSELSFEISPITRFDLFTETGNDTYPDILAPEIYGINYESYMELSMETVEGVVKKGEEIIDE